MILWKPAEARQIILLRMRGQLLQGGKIEVNDIVKPAGARLLRMRDTKRPASHGRESRPRTGDSRQPPATQVNDIVQSAGARQIRLLRMRNTKRPASPGQERRPRTRYSRQPPAPQFNDIVQSLVAVLGWQPF
jgi:hypothetical protein